MVIRLNSTEELQSELIHSPFYPEQILDGDPVSAEVRIDADWQTLAVWRYSPFGIDLAVKDLLSFEKGQTLDLVIRLGKQKFEHNGLVVSSVYKEGDQNLVGIRTFSKVEINRGDKERRNSTRWYCDVAFLPSGTAASAVRYNDFIVFRVQDISAKGLRLVTSMRNKFVSVGQHLDATISLPLVGSVNVSLRVRYVDTVNVDNKSQLTLGCEILGADPVTLESFAEYLLNFAEGVSIATLKEQGFPIRRSSKWFDFTYVKNESDYEEVLNLRFNAYGLAGKLNPSFTHKDMADEYDARARISIVKHNGKIVGTMRLMFPQQGDKTEHERFIGSPKNLPNKTESVIATRLCTSPEYRGGDIFYELMAHMVLSAVKSGRRYLYFGASGSLIDLYVKCGMSRTGIEYKNIDLGDVPHEIIIMDVFEVAKGNGINAKYWNKIYRVLADYLIQQEYISPTPFEMARLKFLKLLGSYQKS